MKDIGEQLRLDKEVQDTYLKGIEDQLALYRGQRVTRDGKVKDTPENPVVEILSIMLPLVGFSDPQVGLSSRITGEGDPQLEAFQVAMQRWVCESRLNRIVRRGLIDAMFRTSCVLLRPERRRGSKVLEWPTPRVLSPRRFVFDRCAVNPDERAYTWHLEIRDKAELLKAIDSGAAGKGWDRKAVEGAPEAGDTPRTSVSGMALRKGQIAYWEGWFRDGVSDDGGPEDGYNGCIERRLDSDPEVRLSRPVGWFGPESGPYHALWYYDSGGESPYGVSPLSASQGAINDLEDQSSALDRNLRRRKKIAIVSRQNADLAQKVKAAPDGSVQMANVEDLQKDLREVELGAPTEAQIAAVIMARERVRNATGITDAQRGIVTGVGTATENMQAAAGSNSRTGYLQQVTAEWAEGITRAAGWWVWYSRSVAVETGRDPEGRAIVHVGGEADGSKPDYVNGYRALDMEVQLSSVEKGSMGARVAEAQDTLAIVERLCQLPPWANTQQVSDYLAQKLARPELSTMVNGQMKDELMGAQMSANTESTQPVKLYASPGAVGGNFAGAGKATKKQAKINPMDGGGSAGPMAQAKKMLGAYSVKP